MGQAAGFDIMKSNNLPDGAGAGAGKAMIAGYRGAATLAEQIVSVEAGRMEKRAAIAGRRVTRHKALFPCTRA